MCGLNAEYSVICIGILGPGFPFAVKMETPLPAGLTNTFFSYFTFISNCHHH